nr:MAG TPA: hypothetical protein [Caudoviricetes sp.]
MKINVRFCVHYSLQCKTKSTLLFACKGQNT